MVITFTRNATLDLKDHFEYIKNNRSVEKARAFRKKLFNQIEYLKAFPRMGALALEYENLTVEVRYILEGNYKIYYQVTREVIFILNIVSTFQNK